MRLREDLRIAVHYLKMSREFACLGVYIFDGGRFIGGAFIVPKAA